MKFFPITRGSCISLFLLTSVSSHDLKSLKSWKSIVWEKNNKFYLVVLHFQKEFFHHIWWKVQNMNLCTWHRALKIEKYSAETNVCATFASDGGAPWFPKGQKKQSFWNFAALNSPKLHFFRTLHSTALTWLGLVIIMRWQAFSIFFQQGTLPLMGFAPSPRLSANVKQPTAKEGAMRWSADTNQCTSTRGLPNWCPHPSPSCRPSTCRRPLERARSDPLSLWSEAKLPSAKCTRPRRPHRQSTIEDRPRYSLHEPSGVTVWLSRWNSLTTTTTFMVPINANPTIICRSTTSANSR